MPQQLLYLDLETRSELSPRDCGSPAYAEHPSTNILCCAWAIDEEPVQVLTYEQLLPDEKPCVQPIQALLDEYPDAVIVTHNNDFERYVLSALVDPMVMQRAFVDTAVESAGLGLPRNLEDMTAFLWPNQPEMQKDAEGSRVMLQLSKPRRPSKADPYQWWTPATKPEAFQRLYTYCMRDVTVMRASRSKLRPLTPQEHRVWQMTNRMNDRGIQIDTASIPLAQAYLARALAPLEEEFSTLVPYAPKSYKRVAAHLGLPDVKKATVRHALRDPAIPEHTKRALYLLRQLSLSSPAKLGAMLQRVSRDGRLRGALVYGGAERTLRWSSWGVQLQNMKRGLGELTDTAFEALALDCLAEIFTGVERQAPEPPADEVALVAEMMRGFLMGPFLVGDFAQIEARTLAWIAGQDDLVDLFRTKGDPYCAQASRIYGRPITKKDKSERFMGKQVILGCGYAMGHVRFRNMLDEVYDTPVTEDFAKQVIATYRASMPRIVRLWDVLMNGFRHVVVNRSHKVKIPDLPVNLFMGTETIGGTFYAWIELPSGRRLWYADAHVKGKEVRYFGRNIYKGGAWEIVPTHGGKITENCFTGDCKVVTADGIVPIAEVKAGALVWDGEEWVPTGGAHCSGEQEVGTWLGVRVTRNHLINDGTWWRSVGSLDESASRRCLAWGLGSARLLCSQLCPESTGKPNAVVTAADLGLATHENCDVDARRARNAGGGGEAPADRIHPSQRYSPTPNCARLGPIGTPASCLGATTRSALPTRTTVGGESECTRRGSPTGCCSSPTPRPCQDGTTSRSTSTASTTPEATSPETCACVRAARTPGTRAATSSSCTRAGPSQLRPSRSKPAQSGPSERSTTTSPEVELPNGSWIATGERTQVWDLLNCGPRHQFMILTGEGPVIVHNCVQATARDVMAEAMLRLEERGFKLEGTVHDEVIVADEVSDRLEEFRAAMVEVPAWAKGLPLDVDVFRCTRYRK